jgi:hypothetical protein
MKYTPLIALTALVGFGCQEKPVIYDNPVSQPMSPQKVAMILCGNDILDMYEECEGDAGCIDCKITSDYCFGDLDVDGDIDRDDAQCAVSAGVGKKDCLRVADYFADLSCDGILDVSDAAIISSSYKMGELHNGVDSNYNGIPDCKE